MGHKLIDSCVYQALNNFLQNRTLAAQKVENEILELTKIKKELASAALEETKTKSGVWY